MATNVSTGYVERALSGTGAFPSIFRYGVIEIRTGPQPATADAAATGTLIAKITRNGNAWTAGSPTNGLEFAAGGRYVSKQPEHTWRLKGITTGTAGWFRLLGNAFDDNSASTTAPRIDGTIDVAGADSPSQMFMTTTSVTASTNLVIPHWWYAIPPL